MSESDRMIYFCNEGWPEWLAEFSLEQKWVAISAEQMLKLDELGSGFLISYMANDVGGDAQEKSFKHLSLLDLSLPKQKPICVNFESAKLDYRTQHQYNKKALNKNELIAKAVAVAPELRVLDATAGLGTDSFVLAAYGCKVVALESSPVVYALLRDGLERAQEAVYAGEITHSARIARRISLLFADAVSYMRELSLLRGVADERLPQVVYLDPMYPYVKKSALPKKEMQVFRRLLGHTQNIDELLEAARSCALERVVVKRPLEAKPCGQPQHVFEGKTARYDFYLPFRA